MRDPYTLRFPIGEVLVEFGCDRFKVLEYHSKWLPHHKQIAEHLPAEIRDLHLVQAFPPYIQRFVDACWLEVSQSRGNTVGELKVSLRPHFRWTEARIHAVREELEAQLSDGFGESLMFSAIPGVAEEYRLCLG